MARVSLFRLWLLLATVGESLAKVGAVQPKHILHFSDVHLNLSTKLQEAESKQIALAYGDDTPVSLLTSALTYAKQLLAFPELLVYTGDHAVHGDLEDEYLAAVVETNVETLDKFYPAKNGSTLDTTAIMGNADTNPDYTIDVTDGEEVNPALALIAGAWNDSLSESDMDTFTRKGFLQYSLGDNLVVLTFNTVPYSPSHLPDTTDKPDPFGQFAWLNATLDTLKKENKSAYIVGHIPPIVDSFSGAQMWEASYIATYKQVVGYHASVIKAQLFGHVHSVEFRVPVDEEQNSAEGFELVPLFTTAAISPIYGNNPAFVVWDYHPATYELLDFAVYGTNISGGSADSLQWRPLFNASQAYGVSSLTTSELNKFIERVTSDPVLLQTYYYNSKALSYRQASCLDAICQAKWLCTLRWWTTSEEYKECVADMEAINEASTVEPTPTPTPMATATKTPVTDTFVAIPGAC